MNSEPGTINSYKVKKIIDGDVISLRKVNLKGIKQLYHELQSPGVLNNLSLDIENISDLRNYLIYLSQQWNYNHNFTYIINLSSGEPIGMVTLFDLNFTHQRAELGIWVGHSYRKNGYGKETLGLLIAYAFHDLKLNRLEAHIFPENESSLNLFSRSGFQFEGLRKEYVRKGSEFIDVVAYSLLRSKFETNGAHRQ